MVSIAKDLDNCLRPSSGREILEFAYDLTVYMHIYHRFSNENNSAERYFYYHVMNRYFHVCS